VKTLLVVISPAGLKAIYYQEISAQRGALQSYEDFLDYARRSSPNSYGTHKTLLENGWEMIWALRNGRVRENESKKKTRLFCGLIRK